MGRKVLFVHDGPLGVFQEKYYGVHYTNELINQYAFFGDSVTFLMRSKELKLEEISRYELLDEPKFNFISIPNFKTIRSFFLKIEATKRINQAVIEHDLIIVRLPSAAGVIAFKEAKRNNKPVLVELVSCVYDALWNYDWRGKLIAKSKLNEYQRLMKSASHSIYVTNEFLQSRYPTNGKSIGCSDVELQDLDENILQERLLSISQRKESLKLATVGAIDVAYKGQADVIRAIKLLKDQGILFYYYIIGGGNPNTLQSLVDELGMNDYVKITGPLPHGRVFDHFKEIDIYVQPSKQEGLPRAVVEAMSMACPVIGARTGGIPELIMQDCIFSPGDILEIAKKLAQVDTEWLESSAKNNFSKAQEYDKKKLHVKRTAFYKEFLKDSFSV